ncbi:TPA: hypothetical protein ACX6QU_002062 [Photobacterium damselae]|uniref:hypothetical protein n=1 Tax=Photobacterium damselae TaxID=38293 RepID=UPI000D05EC95|nr:hypothetical protein [Photobacterium damselae]ELI6448021.1 hypothetical protein [Photobacterium damselae]PSB89372.1 hypothetical protein C5F63_05285 [Photobacterium damselae subsp. damselae]
MKKLCLAAILLATASHSFADDHIPSDLGEWEDCGPVNVAAVQAEHNGVMILLENQSEGWFAWKRLGVTQDKPVFDGLVPRSVRGNAEIDGNLEFNTSSHIMQFQSLAEKALLNNKKVKVRFEGDEVCHADNYNSNAVMIRLIK